MKITAEDYKRLEPLITTTIEKVIPNIHVPVGHELNQIQHIWNVWHITVSVAQRENQDNYRFLRSLYDYLNDDHIETALKKIILG